MFAGVSFSATPSRSTRRKLGGDVASVAGGSGSGTGSTAASPSPSVSISPTKLPKIMRCIGCMRVKGTDFSVMVAGELVEWADDRGLWCKLCTNVHRTCLADKLGLSSLSGHLQLGNNRADFLMMCVAYLTLQQECLIVLVYCECVLICTLVHAALCVSKL